MDQERQEVYERIPWETLDKKRGDHQWLIMSVAGAVAIGALAFSFMQNRSPATPLPAEPVVTVAHAPAQPQVAPSTTAQPVSPVVMAEADLYAVDPRELVDRVAAHAEWFAVEYFSVDGSQQSQLTSLLPVGIPAPLPPDGVQVFVDWVRARGVTEVAPLNFEVEVVVRSLVAQGEEPFARQPVRLATIPVVVGDDGSARVSGAPVVEMIGGVTPAQPTLVAPPPEVVAQVEASHGAVVGGEQMNDGRWRVVTMVTGVDGVSRPQAVLVP